MFSLNDPPIRTLVSTHDGQHLLLGSEDHRQNGGSGPELHAIP